MNEIWQTCSRRPDYPFRATCLPFDLRGQLEPVTDGDPAEAVSPPQHPPRQAISDQRSAIDARDLNRSHSHSEVTAPTDAVDIHSEGNIHLKGNQVRWAGTHRLGRRRELCQLDPGRGGFVLVDRGDPSEDSGEDNNGCRRKQRLTLFTV